MDTNYNHNTPILLVECRALWASLSENSTDICCRLISRCSVDYAARRIPTFRWVVLSNDLCLFCWSEEFVQISESN